MVKQNGLRFLTFNMYSPVFQTRSLKEFESINGALQIQSEPLFPRPTCTSKKFFLKEATKFYVFYCFIYIQNKWKFLKKEMHVYKLSLCTYNHFLGFSILFPHVATYVWTERNKGFVSCFAGFYRIR